MKLKLGIVLVITAACVAVVLWDLDFHEAWVALQQAQWILLAPMFGLYLVAHCLRAWRLQLLVRHDVTYGRAFAINNADQIVGGTTTSLDCLEAFLWAGGVYQQTLGFLSGHVSSSAMDINNASTVAKLSSWQRRPLAACCRLV